MYTPICFIVALDNGTTRECTPGEATTLASVADARIMGVGILPTLREMLFEIGYSIKASDWHVISHYCYQPQVPPEAVRYCRRAMRALDNGRLLAAGVFMRCAASRC